MNRKAVLPGRPLTVRRSFWAAPLTVRRSFWAAPCTQKFSGEFCANLTRRVTVLHEDVITGDGDTCQGDVPPPGVASFSREIKDAPSIDSDGQDSDCQ